MGDVSLEEMAALGELVCYPSSTAAEARERVRDADVVCLNKVIVDQAFLDAAPKLKANGVKMTERERKELIASLESKMRKAAEMLEYEIAAQLRDEIIRLRGKS